MRIRWLLVAGLGAIGAAALMAAAALQAPGWIARRVERELASRGLAPARVRIDAIGLRRAHLAFVEIGSRPGVRADDVTVTYGPRALWSGWIDSVEVGSLTVDAAWQNGGVAIGPLDSLWAQAAPPARAADARPGEGPVRRPSASDEPPLLPARIEVARATVTLRHGEDTWEATGPVELAFDGRGVSALRAEVRAAGPRDTDARLLLQATAEAPLAIELTANAAAGFSPGSPRVRLDASGSLPAEWLRLWEGSPTPSLATVEAEVRFSLALEELRVGAETLGAELHGALSLAQGRFVADLAEIVLKRASGPLALRARAEGSLAPARIEALSLTTPPLAEGALEVPAAEIAFAGTLDAQAARGELRILAGPGRLAYEGLSASGAELSGAFQLDATREQVALRLPECAALRADRATFGEWTLDAPALCLRDAGEPLLARAASGEGSLRAALRSLRPLEAADGSGLRVSGELPEVEVRADLAKPGIAFSLAGGRLQADGTPWSLRDLRAVARAEADRWELALAHASAVPHDGAALRAPLSVSGSASGDDAFVRFALEASEPRGEARLRARGVHRLASGYGAARVELPSVRLAEDGLRLVDLMTDVTGLPTVAGGVGANGAVAWNPRRLEPSLEVVLTDLDVETPDVAVRGANGVVSVRGVESAATRAGQPLSAQAIDVGIPLRGAVLAFALSSGSRIDVSRFSAEIAGGRATLRGALDPASNVQSMHVELDGVDLGEALRMAEVRDVNVRGRVSGVLPIELRGGALRVRGGVLHAPGNGWIQVPPESSASALEASGEPSALVRAVLTDFYFTQLGLTIDGELGGTLRLAFTIRGSNPAVQDGREILLRLTVHERITGASNAEALWRALVEQARRRRAARAQGG